MASQPDLTPEFLAYDEGPFIVKMSIAMALLATLFVCLRLWARRHTRIKHGLDDWVIISALIFIYGYVITGLIAVYHGGAGKYVAVNRMDDPEIVSKAVLYISIGDPLYATSITLLKACILIMYCRIFPTRSMKIGGSALGVIVLTWWLVVCLLTIFQCRPIKKAWSMSTTEGTCIDKGTWFTAVAVPNIVTDAAILSLPICEVSRLQLSRTRKVVIAGIFLLGGFVVIISCVRLQCLLNLRGGENADFTRLVACIWWWTVVELSVACVSACLPTLRPLVRLSYGRLFNRKPKSNGTANNFNAVATIGSAPSRRPAVIGSNSAESCQRLGDGGALAEELYSEGKRCSREGTSREFWEQASSPRKDVIAMDTVTIAHQIC